jgi:hypothetical protein
MDERRPTVEEIAARVEAEEPTRGERTRHNAPRPSRPTMPPSNPPPAAVEKPIENPALTAELERLKEEAHEACVRACARLVALSWPDTDVKLTAIRLGISLLGGRASMKVSLRISRKIL